MPSDLRWTWRPFEALAVGELYELLKLRQRVFVVEQACAYLDADGRDPDALHLLGHDADGRLVAVLRVFPPDPTGRAVIGRVVTAPEVRGAGVGTALMREGLRRVRTAFGPVPIHLSAQAHLAGWYRSLGFEVSGPGYDEDGIPHLPMDRPPGT